MYNLSIQNLTNSYEQAANSLGISKQNSLFNALASANVATAYALGQNISNVVKNAFFETALDLESLTTIASNNGIRPPLTSSQSKGYLSVYSTTNGVPIDSGTVFTSSSYGTTYNAIQSTLTIKEGWGTSIISGNDTYYSNPLTISTSTETIGTLICTTNYAHNLGVGMGVYLGSNSSSETAKYTINMVKDAYTFTVTAKETQLNNGTISAWQTNIGYVLSQCNQGGYSGNLTLDNTLSTNIVNTAISSAYTNYQGLTGGAGAESIDSYRSFCLDQVSQGRGEFNNNAVTYAVKSINGNTRCWINEATTAIATYPVTSTSQVGQGQAQVYYVRDLESSNFIFPSQTSNINQQTQDAVYQLLNITNSKSSVYVGSPQLLNFDITLQVNSQTQITPELLNVVESSLISMLYLNANVGEDLSVQTVMNTLSNIVNPDTNQLLSDIIITNINGVLNPTVNDFVNVGYGELLYLNNLTVM